jgi:hypothetical protein
LEFLTNDILLPSQGKPNQPDLAAKWPDAQEGSAHLMGVAD